MTMSVPLLARKGFLSHITLARGKKILVVGGYRKKVTKCLKTHPHVEIWYTDDNRASNRTSIPIDVGVVLITRWLGHDLRDKLQSFANHQKIPFINHVVEIRDIEEFTKVAWGITISMPPPQVLHIHDSFLDGFVERNFNGNPDCVQPEAGRILGLLRRKNHKCDYTDVMFYVRKQVKQLNVKKGKPLLQAAVRFDLQVSTVVETMKEPLDCVTQPEVVTVHQEPPSMETQNQLISVAPRVVENLEPKQLGLIETMTSVNFDLCQIFDTHAQMPLDLNSPIEIKVETEKKPELTVEAIIGWLRDDPDKVLMVVRAVLEDYGRLKKG